MTTLSVIEDRVRQNVEDLPSATDARVTEMVNRAQERIEGKYSFLCMRTESIVATVEDQRTLGTSGNWTGWIGARGEPYWIDGNGNTKRMEWIHSARDVVQEYQHLNATEKGAPRALLELVAADGTRTMEVYPFPDANNPIGTVYVDGNYRVAVPFMARLPALTDTNQTNFFTTDPPSSEYLEHYATGLLQLFNRDYENANVSMVRAQDALSRAIREERRRQMAGVTIRPRRDLHGSRVQPRS